MSEPSRADETSNRQDKMMAAEVLLRSLREHGVTYAFSNLGTDHPALLEAAAKAREDGEEDAVPTFVTCPHETVALAAAHGYAAATGEPQAVIVHVDVGTQNMGAMIHNAHRGDAPIFIFAGLAPVTNQGHNASRTNSVHFLQDVFDQAGILREYCRWTGEYRLPGDPDELVARGLELASTPRRGPVYLSASAEALETSVETELGSRSLDRVRPTAADPDTVDEVTSLVSESESPLVVTSKSGLTDPNKSVETLVEFAEAAGAGVVEARPAALCFPRTHDLHAGFSLGPALERADCVIAVDVDVPWVPAPESAPSDDVPTVQIDFDPTKPAFPQWDLSVDLRITAAPMPTLAAVTDRLDPAHGDPGRQTWQAFQESKASDLDDALAEHEESARLTGEVLSSTINEFVDESTIVVNETTTNSMTALSYLDLERPGSYFNSHGSGLGWAPGAAVGVKLGRPDANALSLVGDGSYVFGHPTSTAWVADAFEAPTLTVIYNNSGWNAVRGATRSRHPGGSASAVDVPESKFDPTFDLSHAANVADAHTTVVESNADLVPALEAGFEAINNGTQAVLDVRIESI